MRRDPRRQGDGLVEHGAGVAHLEGQAELDQFGRADPVRGQEHPRRLLPPHQRGEEEAAGRLGGHAQLGEGDAQARLGVDQHEVAMGEQREAEPDRDAVDGGEQRHRQVDEAVEQAHEPLSRPLDGGPGGDGGHFGQVLTRGEGGAAAGEHDRPDRLVAVGGAQGGGDLLVHGRVEGVAHLGPVEGDDADAGCGLVDLDPAVRHVVVQASASPAAAAWRRMTVSAAALTPMEMGQPM